MLEKVRAAITAQLLNLGAGDGESVRETILVRQGLYCGRKFESHGYYGVWFVEENQIKFFSPAGELLQAMSVDQCIGGQIHESRRAA